MKEYKIEYFTELGILSTESVKESLTFELNKYAKEGWRVVNVQQRVSGTDFAAWLIVLEK